MQSRADRNSSRYRWLRRLAFNFESFFPWAESFISKIHGCHLPRMRQRSISAFPAQPLAATPHLRAVVAEPPARSVLYVESTRRSTPQLEPWSRRSVILLLSLWAALFLAASATPSLLDDADATHAQASQAMLHTGDWVTLHVNGIRYLEKPPLPYWIAACSMRIFGETPFATHLPLALATLALPLLGYAWGRRAFIACGSFDACAGLYA